MSSLSFLVGICLIGLTTAQVVEFGSCRNYQTPDTFNEDYIIKMAKEPNGYVAVLSSGDPHNCQSLKFKIGGFFEYSYIDDDNTMQKYDGTYSAKTSTFTQPGFIDLNLPTGVFGARLSGQVRLNVLVANDDQLVLASCTPVGLLRVEQIHGFVPSSKVTEESHSAMSDILTLRDIPHSARLRTLNHLCIPRAEPDSAGVLTSLLAGSGFTRARSGAVQTPVGPIPSDVANNVMQYSALAQQKSYLSPIGYVPGMVQYSAPVGTVPFTAPSTVVSQPAPVSTGGHLLYNRFYY